VDVGLLYSRIRQDEKLLLNELRDRGHEVHKVDVRDQQFGLQSASADFDAMDLVLDRTLATSPSSTSGTSATTRVTTTGTRRSRGRSPPSSRRRT